MTWLLKQDNPPPSPFCVLSSEVRNVNNTMTIGLQLSIRSRNNLKFSGWKSVPAMNEVWCHFHPRVPTAQLTKGRWSIWFQKFVTRKNHAASLRVKNHPFEFVRVAMVDDEWYSLQIRNGVEEGNCRSLNTMSLGKSRQWDLLNNCLSIFFLPWAEAAPRWWVWVDLEWPPRCSSHAEHPSLSEMPCKVTLIKTPHSASSRTACSKQIKIFFF